MTLPLNQILHTDALSGLQSLPDGCVDCMVTSPPYYGLRDYGVVGQIGLEKSLDEYIDKLVAIFHEARRVLKNSGTLWVNMGDSYAGSGKGYGDMTAEKWKIQRGNKGTRTGTIPPNYKPQTHNLKPKDLIGTPWLLAFAMRADGWYLRDCIIWHKPNPMPESVNDRTTKAHEYIFLFSKSKKYFYDAEAIKEEKALSTINDKRSNENGTLVKNGFPKKRSVWTIATESYSGAHFATFPQEIPSICIKAGSSEYGCCTECGKPYERIVKKSGGSIGHGSWTKHDGNDIAFGVSSANTTLAKQMMRGQKNDYRTESKGWRKTCKCDCKEIARAVVLDPFSGTNTTGIVANKLGRDFISFELKAEYIKLAEKRMRATLDMFNPSSLPV